MPINNDSLKKYKVNKDWINEVRERLIGIEKAYAEKRAAYITYNLERL